MEAKDTTIVTISDFFKTDSYGNKIGIFECHCGKIFSSLVTRIKQGIKKSCGCLKNKSKHGRNKTVEHGIWCGIRNRCLNKNNKAFASYGGRGITVSEEWLSSFENFYRDMGPRPGKDYSIDRIDNDKGYSKENCRWATRKEQNNNQRSNRIIEFNNKSQNLTAWAAETGFAFDTLRARLDNYGWSVEQAFTTPLKVQRGKNRS